MQEAANRNQDDLVILDDRCFFDDTAACLTHEQWVVDLDRNAAYWTKARIKVNTKYAPWASGALAGAIAHEMGHAIGLHECYDPVSGCNSSETTIMDAAIKNQNGERITCDNLQGPAADDITRVTSYWSQGTVAEFTGTADGTVGIWTWRDYAWAEHQLDMYWYYWDANTQGSWVPYASKTIIEGIGVHKETENRLFTARLDRTAFGAPAGTHMACSSTYFIKWDVRGAWTCTSDVELPPAVVVSTVSIEKIKGLWNGTSNDAPPAGWQEISFDDSPWTPSVLQTSYWVGQYYDKSQPPGAAYVTNINGDVHSNYQYLLRRSFTLPPGPINTATLKITIDDYGLGIWLNGVYLGDDLVRTSVPPLRQPKTFTIDPAILRPGATNVLAVWQKNPESGVSGPMATAFRLEVW